MSIASKQQLALGCRLLNAAGLFDEHGHLSARTSNPEEVFINAFASPATTTIRDYITVDLDTTDYPDSAPGETPIHTQIFRNRADVEAICHNHSPYSMLLSSLDIEMRPVHPNGAIQKNPVSIYEDYDEAGGMLITTEKEGQAVADTLGDDSVVMLRGHGAVVVGSSVEEVLTKSLKLEYNSEMLYKQAAIGEPWYPPEEIVGQNVENMLSEGQIVKTLDYYFSEL